MILTGENGFTIIELVVVIAIIAILAGIVLINVTNYLNKSKDVTIKTDLVTVWKNSSLYYINNNYSYSGFIIDTAMTSAIQKINGNNPPTLSVKTTTSDYFCACSPLTATTNDLYCVDSTGVKIEKVLATGYSAECTTSTGQCVVP